MAATSFEGAFAVDRISNLPCDITDHILNNLPLRDVARTSILSREWRYKLVTIPNLVFDRDFKQSLHRNCDLESIIDQILLLHRGPIVKFSLKDINIKHNPWIHHWLDLLSNHCIEELTLRFSYSPTYHSMPHFLFSFDRLRHLYLANCDVRPPPTFEGFGRLVRLDLVSVQFELCEFKRFLSKCPVLEFLNMRSFNGNSIWHFDIDAPKLKSLHFWGKFSSMWFGNAALEELSVCYSDFVLSEEGILVEDYEMPESPGNGLNLFKIFSQLSSIERLEINGRTMQVLALGGAPEKLPNHLDNLALIQLSDIDLGHTDEVACALCLIRSSPNLQRLEIKFETTDNSAPDGAIRYLKSLQKRKTPLSRSLKNIKIENFSGAEPELEFIKLFLSAATVLQKLEIKAGFCESNDEGAWSPRSLLQELESFSPSSSKVAVLFD
ncbi:F-box/FBD/LRR-repeat protein At1g13570-like isoform X1 [Andrographis paniculata]|uniref:F-box/FBD/LRR-repeat protein At1g13570-like isoform X1 n=1 Tax=Andrographis paniculata TaxID=175694 RepID=UPI0021E87CA8|nr:F-box/FBD/LRR-repeat protein At1g13570-like isoform X1 [Andrographis paniculata]